MKYRSGFLYYNLGCGNDFEVLDVIESCQRVVVERINYDIEPRLEGDPAKLVSDATKAIRILGWKPDFSNLDSIIRTAWLWHAP
jgi:UDP-glucose 4-epimerase